MKNHISKNKNKRGIQSYVDYLLDDILNAEGQESDRESSFKDETDLMAQFAEMEQLVLEDPLNTFGQICGLIKEQFPPAEQLSARQIKKINKAFRQLLFSWNLGLDFPKKFPSAKQYKLLVSVLDEKTHILKNGFAFFEFCTCDPDSCPFEEYCTCRDHNEKKNKKSNNDDSSKTKSESV